MLTFSSVSPSVDLSTFCLKLAIQVHVRIDAEWTWIHRREDRLSRLVCLDGQIQGPGWHDRLAFSIPKEQEPRSQEIVGVDFSNQSDLPGIELDAGPNRINADAPNKPLHQL